MLSSSVDSFTHIEMDFFKFFQQIIAQATADARFNLAHNRAAAFRCLEQFWGKERLEFDVLSADFMAQFKSWMILGGLKESTARLYINQVSTVYNAAVKEGIAPEKRLLQGIQSTMPSKQERQLLTEEELHRMRNINLSDSKRMAYARDLFMFSIYGRGISFTDMAYLKKSDVKGKWLTYTSQVANPSSVTVPWDAAMQEIVNRYPSTTDYLLPILKSDKEDDARRNIRQVRENMVHALKQVAARCDLSVVPSMYMVKDIYQRAIDSVCVSEII